MRVLKTKYLFRSLVSLLQPDAIFDVGSLNGSDALHFERIAPRSRVFAFEASAGNAEAIRRNVAAKASRVACVECAVGATDGSAEFLVWDDPSAGAGAANPGMHSTRPRAEALAGSQSRVRVPMCRLDSFARERVPQGAIALWIDVEGASYDVLSGARGIRDRIAFVHAEVETQEIWRGQKTERDVLALAGELGLAAIARGANPVQRDLVLVPASLLQQRAGLLRSLGAFCAAHGSLTAAACRGLIKIGL